MAVWTPAALEAVRASPNASSPRRATTLRASDSRHPLSTEHHVISTTRPSQHKIDAQWQRYSNMIRTYLFSITTGRFLQSVMVIALYCKYRASGSLSLDFVCIRVAGSTSFAGLPFVLACRPLVI